MLKDRIAVSMLADRGITKTYGLCRDGGRIVLFQRSRRLQDADARRREWDALGPGRTAKMHAPRGSIPGNEPAVTLCLF